MCTCRDLGQAEHLTISVRGDAMSETRNLTVLVGNGLSVAFNPELRLQNITQTMLERIQASSDGGEDVVAAMKQVASWALPSGATTDEDFEVLVGAFGAEGRTLTHLHDLAQLVSPDDEELSSAFRKVIRFAERVRDLGMSHVLQVIFERSRAEKSKADSLHSFIRAVAQSFNGRIVFGNLNYDALLLAALLEVCDHGDIADMAWAKVLPKKLVTVTNDDGSEFKVPSLRRYSSDFPTSRRIWLLHPHGSLTFWADRAKDIHVKLETERLEDAAFWTQLREEETPLRPDVVLANQSEKSVAVEEYPFKLAYDMLETSFGLSTHWLIVGYSFRDEKLNRRLKETFGHLEPLPQVMVVTHGASPSRSDVEMALGWESEDGSTSHSWLSVYDKGANGFETSTSWADFSQQP